MQTLRTAELRKWASERKFPDSWWFVVDGKDAQGPSPLAEIPKAGTVLLLNMGSRESAEEQWFVYRYRGFKTEEEKNEEQQARNRPTIKQIVALEFFGQKSDQLTKDQARELLEKYFQGGHNYGRYQDHVYANLDRIYSGKQLAGKAIEMLQRNLHYLKENISEKRLSQLTEELSNESIPYRQFVDVIRSRHPQMLLAESTRKRKISEYESSNKAIAEYRKSSLAETNKRGCFAILLIPFLLIAAISFVAFEYLPPIFR